MLAHPDTNAELSLCVDASDIAAGAVLHQIVDGQVQPLGFFSKKFDKAQLRYSTYDRELTAMYLDVRHFRYMVEGRACHILTDHKPLKYAFQKNLDKTSPRQARQLNYVVQVTTDVRHIAGMENVPADLLSRIQSLTATLDYDKLSDDQRIAILSCKLCYRSLKLFKLALPGSKKQIYCNISTDRLRPFVTRPFRFKLIQQTHSLAHPRRRTTAKLLTDRYVWPGIRGECTSFVKNCLKCQRSKVD